jgi:hypothetical protein
MTSCQILYNSNVLNDASDGVVHVTKFVRQHSSQKGHGDNVMLADTQVRRQVGQPSSQKSLAALTREKLREGLCQACGFLERLWLANERRGTSPFQSIQIALRAGYATAHPFFVSAVV